MSKHYFELIKINELDYYIFICYLGVNEESTSGVEIDDTPLKTFITFFLSNLPGVSYINYVKRSTVLRNKICLLNIIVN